MERLVELFMDGLRQVGPNIDHIEEVMSKYDENIEEHLKKCDL